MLEYTYLDLPDMFYHVNQPDINVKNIDLVNHSLMRKLDIERIEDLLEFNENTFSESYMGHQFGSPVTLGDGRAHILGERVVDGERFDIALKGSGVTKYSRNGDGRAPLEAVLKEYIYSEFLYNVNIPTTRSLAILELDEMIDRGIKKKAGVIIRVADSHIRVGTIQLAALEGKDELKKVVDYAIDRHYPYLKHHTAKYEMFFDMVVRKEAELVAKWQSIGFIHGVINTDNVLISGETIDFGPCAFLETYDPNKWYSEIDINGRYRFNNQPSIMHWNLGMLGNSLVKLFDAEEEAIAVLQKVLDRFGTYYLNHWFMLMGEKIGINNYDYMSDEDRGIVLDFLNEIEEQKLDYTDTFRKLALGTLDFRPDYGEYIPDYELMKTVNPSFIPRFHSVNAAIELALQGNYSKMHELEKFITKPYNDRVPEYLKQPTDHNFNTTCGT
ncbi:protein adenylyltransferase SelO family protein [Phocicoccus pinnipedialis]|uniref:Protein nucleotidyltransferase YdiU n=2 Tax=Phocicoccus pinnipedialis TaxID=110845 RepID=A0A6V7RFL8_9BACL|nr:Protein adenylyltransferase SelO [Jeotgalicoccus pinnipedialis]